MDENFLHIEWEVENFSFWNHALHGYIIESLPFFTNTKGYILRLYPRDVGGSGKYLTVLLGPSCELNNCEISVIASDKLVMYIHRSREERTNEYIQLPVTFEEVSTRIRENKTSHKDRLILKWRLKAHDEKVNYTHVRTVIDVIETSLMIDTGHFKLENFVAINNGQNLISCNYPLENGGIGFLSISAHKRLNEENMSFRLETLNKNKTHVRVCISILDRNDTIKKAEEDCAVDRDDKGVLSYSLPLKSIKNNEYITITLTLKITTGNRPITYILYGPCKTKDDCTAKNCPKVPELESQERVSIIASRQPEKKLEALSSDLICLYQEQELTDFELHCGGVSFATHTAILAARSPVFKRMLSGDMREARLGSMVIEDLDAHTIGRFLNFLYSGTSEGLQWQDALKLYYAAEKYQVPTLTSECAPVLSANVSISNVCDILSLSDKHQDQGLESAARDFILENYNEVLMSDEWKRFSVTEPILLLKTVNHFAESGKVKICKNK